MATTPGGHHPDEPPAKRQSVDAEFMKGLMTNLEHSVGMKIASELQPVKVALTECVATSRQALDEARKVVQRQDVVEAQVVGLTTKVADLESKISADVDMALPGVRPRGAAAAASRGTASVQTPSVRTAGSAVSTATAVQAQAPSKGRPVIIMGGWARDTPRAELEAAARALLHRVQDALVTCPPPVDVNAPFLRGSMVNIKFDNHSDMWAFFKALKAKEKESGNLESDGTRIWVTPDKPIEVRNRDKIVRKAAVFCKGELGLQDAEVEIDWKLSLIWAKGQRLAKLHRDTGLVQFNLKYITELGKDQATFLRGWDAACKAVPADDW